MEESVIKLQKWWMKLPRCKDCGMKWSFVSTFSRRCDFCEHDRYDDYCDACKDGSHYWDDEAIFNKLYRLRHKIQYEHPYCVNYIAVQR